MILTYYGEGGFRLQNGDFSLLVDPPTNQYKANIILKTLTPVSVVTVPDNEVIFPGEYEMSGVEILGWQLLAESTENFIKTIYSVRWEDMQFVFLGHLSKVPGAELLDKIGEPDVLFVPVGGGHFLSAEAAAKLSKSLAPSLIVPSFYQSPSDFSKAFGQKVEIVDKFVFKRKDLAEAKSKVIVFKRS